MRILLLCDRYPNSYRDGLLLRVLHLAKRLRVRHQIDLLCYHDGPVTVSRPRFLGTSGRYCRPPDSSTVAGLEYFPVGVRVSFTRIAWPW